MRQSIAGDDCFTQINATKISVNTADFPQNGAMKERSQTLGCIKLSPRAIGSNEIRCSEIGIDKPGVAAIRTA